MAFNHKHLIDIREYSDTDLMTILETAKAFSQVNERAIKKVPTLKGKTIALSTGGFLEILASPFGTSHRDQNT